MSGEPEFDEREQCADGGFVLARIEYPGNRHCGWLIYLKTTFTNSASGDLYGYRRAEPSFPDQSTADQFFDERQFEAYRELGFQLANDMVADDRGTLIRRNDEIAACLGLESPT